MGARGVQSSIDNLTVAGETYPWAFTFRSAQAKQLYEISRRVDGLTGAAAESLRLALAVDPASADLASKLLGAQLAIGRCAEAAATAKLMIRIAPQSELAQKLAALPCEPQ